MFTMEITRLIERCRQGDADALGELYKAYAQLLQLRYDTMHKGKEGGLLGQFMEHGNHIVCRKATTLRFQRADNLFQTGHIPCQTFLNAKQVV